MQKTPAYHEAAIKYNDGLAEAAEDLAPEIEHEEVKKWCIAVGKQHRFHAKRHRSALNKLLTKEEDTFAVESVSDGLDVPEPDPEPETGGNAENEEHVESTEAAGEATVTKTFSDGCVDSHKPLEESCDYNPLNMKSPEGDANG